MVGPASPTSRRRCGSTFRPARSRARRSRRECSPSLDHLVPGRCLLGQHRLQRRGGRLDVGRPRLSPQAATTDAVAVSGRFPDPAPQAAQPAAPEIVRQYADTLARLRLMQRLRAIYSALTRLGGRSGCGVREGPGLIPLTRTRLRSNITCWPRVQAADPVEDQVQVAAYAALHHVRLLP